MRCPARQPHRRLHIHIIHAQALQSLATAKSPIAGASSRPTILQDLMRRAGVVAFDAKSPLSATLARSADWAARHQLHLPGPRPPSAGGMGHGAWGI